MYSKFVYILVDQSDKIGWKMADYYFKLCTWLYLLSGSLILQRWARAYRDTKYHASVETNNGAEALNRLLKYQYLPRKRKMTLSNIICTIIEQFIPALHYKYIYQNFKQSDLYRSYNPAVVPSFLQGRPKSTILHCLHRQANSNKFTESMIKMISEGKFEVQGKTKVHVVDFGLKSDEPACSCKDWLCYKVPCKHLFAIFRLFPEWGWEKLPSSYRQSPYLNLDEQAISAYIQPKDDKTALHPDISSQPLSPVAVAQCEATEAIFDELPSKVSMFNLVHVP